MQLNANENDPSTAFDGSTYFLRVKCSSRMHCACCYSRSFRRWLVRDMYSHVEEQTKDGIASEADHDDFASGEGSHTCDPTCVLGLLLVLRMTNVVLATLPSVVFHVKCSFHNAFHSDSEVCLPRMGVSARFPVQNEVYLAVARPALTFDVPRPSLFVFQSRFASHLRLLVSIAFLALRIRKEKTSARPKPTRVQAVGPHLAGGSGWQDIQG